jgi:hypothetical protein
MQFLPRSFVLSAFFVSLVACGGQVSGKGNAPGTDVAAGGSSSGAPTANPTSGGSSSGSSGGSASGSGAPLPDGVVSHVVVDASSPAVGQVYEMAVDASSVYLHALDLSRVPITGGDPQPIAAPSGHWQQVIANEVGAVATMYDGTIGAAYRIDGASPQMIDAPVGANQVPMWLGLDGSSLVMRVTTFNANAPPDSYFVMPINGGEASKLYQSSNKVSFYWDSLVGDSLWVVERNAESTASPVSVVRTPLAGAGPASASTDLGGVASTAGFGGRLYLTMGAGASGKDTSIVSLGPDGDVRTEGAVTAADVALGGALTVNVSGIFLSDGKSFVRVGPGGATPVVTPQDGFDMGAYAFSPDGKRLYWSESKATCTHSSTVNVEGQSEDHCDAWTDELFVRVQSM